jgi:integrase/recombinase XerD
MADSTISLLSTPFVTIYVRHAAICPHKEDSFFKRCRCRKWLRYFLNGKQRWVAAKTRTWTVAEEAKRKLELKLQSADPDTPVEKITVISATRPTIEKAVELFIADKKSQGLSPDILKKYQRELDRFKIFMAGRGKLFPHEIMLEDLTEFRSGWKEKYPSSMTRSKVQERLKGLLRYCFNARMIDREIPLSPIKVDEPPTMPLTDKEYNRLLAIVPLEFTGRKAQRVHAIIQTMRHVGLAIMDAVKLQRTELEWDAKKKIHRIVTARQKTGVHVSVPVKPGIAKEITAAMELNDNPIYAFWNTGVGELQTAVTHWQTDLRQVFRAAGLPQGHPHQLRDTFAVNMLQDGVPLEEVSKMLGHESIKTTERYYAKWVKTRQDRLDKVVTDTWANEEAA